MRLESLAVNQFRNIHSGACDLHPQLNFFYGPNAQGKTNWLEAVYVLSTTRSFRTAKLAEAISYGAEESTVRGIVKRGSAPAELAMKLTARTKMSYFNGKREPTRDYISHMPVFACTLGELAVVRGGPEFRRGFLDDGILSLNASYQNSIDEYQRVLRQKNRLLKNAGRRGSNLLNHKELSVWEDQLIELGTQIHMQRRAYVDDLVHRIPEGLFSQEIIEIQYVSSVASTVDPEEYRQRFRQRIDLRREAEIALGHCLIGPHRDDLNLLLDGRELKKFGSSGQERSALLVLDLARIELYNTQFDEYPLFLVDDLDAELDIRRIETLLAHAYGRTQLFLSTSKFDIPRAFASEAALLRVEGGQLVTNEI